MKYFSLILLLFLLTIACSKREENFEAFSAETFAFDLGDLWEVNATVRVKGVKQVKVKDKVKVDNGEEYYSALTLVIDLIHPDGKIEKNKFSYTHSKKSNEILKDIGLEAQFELDSTYSDGVYKIVFNISDAHSQKSTSIEKELELKR
jgi:hypothetical protein